MGGIRSGHTLKRRLRLHWPTEWLQFWEATREGAAAVIVAGLAEALGALGVACGRGARPVRIQSDTVLIAADGGVRLVPPFQHVRRAEEPSDPGLLRMIDMWTLFPDDSYGPRAQVYQLGKLLWLLAAGGALTPEAAVIEPVVRRCTDRDPARRYADPRAVAAALDGLAPGGYRTSARPRAAGLAELARLVVLAREAGYGRIPGDGRRTIAWNGARRRAR